MSSKSLSIIDSDLRVDGDLEVKGRLLIKGVVRGTITGSRVVIAEDGKVLCDATVEEMVIGGFFEGELKARERVVILASGKCAGTVHCKDFVVESGGVVEAEIVSTRDGKKIHPGKKDEVPMIPDESVKDPGDGEK